MFTLYIVLMIAGPLLHLYFSRAPRTRERVIEVWLLYLLVVGAGLQGIVAFIGHAFIPDEIARSIGWQPGSPFQFEVAVADLSYGVLGIMCIWFRGGFWLATGVATSVFLLGCNYGHIYEALVHANYSPNNYGMINVFEFVWPAAVLILLAMYMRSRGAELTPAGAAAG